METGDVTRFMAVAAKVLISASLFFVLIWWWVSLDLFAAGGALLGVAWLRGGAVSLPPIVQE